MGAICRQLKMWNGFVGPLPEVPRSLAFVCLDKVSLFSHGCLGTQYVDQAGLELIEIHLPLPLECWDKRHVLPYRACQRFLEVGALAGVVPSLSTVTLSLYSTDICQSEKLLNNVNLLPTMAE